MSQYDVWCCPVCGCLNEVRGRYSAQGYCQSMRCAIRRNAYVLRGFVIEALVPEIMEAYCKPEVFA